VGGGGVELGEGSRAVNGRKAEAGWGQRLEENLGGGMVAPSCQGCDRARPGRALAL
jgi:hypothetical protein